MIVSASNTPLRLWTIQHEGAYRALLRTGVLQASPQHIDEDLLPAYTWMSAQLEARVPRPKACSPEFPVWAWLQYDGPHRKKPRLDDQALLPSGSSGVLIEFLVSPKHCLRSDFQMWHAVLNGEYLPIDSEDRRRFEARFANSGEAEPQRLLQQSVIEESWQRVFDINHPGTDCWEGPEERELQVVLWQIEAAMVVSVEAFRAR